MWETKAITIVVCVLTVWGLLNAIINAIKETNKEFREKRPQ